MSGFTVYQDSHEKYQYNIVNRRFTPRSNLEFKLGFELYMNKVYIKKTSHKLGKISDWDVSNVTDMSKLAHKEYDRQNQIQTKVDGVSEFNEDISNWDVSNVTNMEYMFDGFKMFNQPLNSWGPKLSKVTNMSNMFSLCDNFNQPLNMWDVSKVTDMSLMFYGCSKFNQPLNMWSVSNVTNMRLMFSKCSSFDQPLNSWEVSNVTNMEGMFRKCNNFNQPLNSWKVSNVTNMSSMFSGCTIFNQPLNSWGHKLGKVTDLSRMFYGCSSFNQPLNWYVHHYTNKRGIFDHSGMTDENKETIFPYVVSITTEQFDDKPNNECPICGVYDENTRCKTPCCGKVFHLTCLDTWCKNKDECTCPNCRNLLPLPLPLPSTTGRGKIKTKRSLKKSRKTRKHRKSKKN